MKQATTFSIDNFSELKIKMLNWLNQFNIFCLLDNCGYQFEAPAFECMVGVGCRKMLQPSTGNAFEELKQFSTVHNDWLFGHLSYDLKNEFSNLQSNNFDGIGFEKLSFFVPEIVLQLNKNSISIFCADNEAEKIFTAIQNTNTIIAKPKIAATLDIKSRFTKSEYITTIKKIQQHILRGDCYEVNFCQEFFSEHAVIEPLLTYQQLSASSPNPFSALYKLADKYCICASPERYLKKSGDTLFSQPIKGTAKRYLKNAQADENSKIQLLKSEKERSENVMVVDLVRNDLSKVCKEGSVQVQELFGIYSFPQVHQMISTISGQLEEGVSWLDAIKATFPMASMTGAPKLRVMQIIEEFERTKRGLFSGAIGYVSPEGNFDFNVVIRSILYNSLTNYVSFQAGSAITFYSDAQMEYEECLLKVAVIKKVLEAAL